MAKKKTKKASPKKRESISSNSTSLRNWSAAIGIFTFAFLLYSYTFSDDFEYVLDDDLVCAKNDYVQEGIGSVKEIFTHSWYHGFSGTADRYYRPMMLAGLALDTSLFGGGSKVHHFMNVLYYALGSIFLFFTLKLFFPKDYFWVALGSTLLFTAHPLHTEVVANIKSRDELFAFLGLLGVIYSIVQYNRKSDVIYFALALFGYFFAILSKEAALSTLGLVPLVLYFFTNTSFQKIGIQTGSFLIVALIYFSIRMEIIDNDPNPFETIDNSLFAIESWSGQLATAIGMLGKYFSLLVFPHPLSFDYSYNTFPELGWGNWKVLLSLVASGGLIYLAFDGLKNKKILSFSIFFFAITFAITSNIFFLIGVTFAERLMFAPLLGFCIAISVLLKKYINEDHKNPPTIFLSIIGVMFLLYSYKTWTQNPIWQNDNTLFETGIRTAPNSSRAQSFYGVMHYRKSQTTQNTSEKNQLLETAVEYLNKSINTYPNFTETYQHLALAYEAQNKQQLAIDTYKKGISTNPKYFPAMTNIGVLSFKMKNYPQAENYLKQALIFAPNNIVAERALGLVYKATNRYDLAATHFKNVLSNQYTEQHLFDLVELYKAKGDIESAIFYDKKVKELRGEIVN